MPRIPTGPVCFLIFPYPRRDSSSSRRKAVCPPGQTYLPRLHNLIRVNSSYITLTRLSLKTTTDITRNIKISFDNIHSENGRAFIFERRA